MVEPYEGFVRAIDIEAPPPLVYRWLCQLKVAPYSYDLIDNLGRRSPPELTPGADELEVGQRFLVFRLVEFGVDDHLTGVALPRARRLYGAMAITYQVSERGAGATRLVVKLDVGASSRAARLRRSLLAAGDYVMMRKQLLTLKERAEGDAALLPADA